MLNCLDEKGKMQCSILIFFYNTPLLGEKAAFENSILKIAQLQPYNYKM